MKKHKKHNQNKIKIYQNQSKSIKIHLNSLKSIKIDRAPLFNEFYRILVDFNEF